MKLKEWDWNRQQYVETDYPDEVIQRFMNWLRTNRQWRESPDPGRDVFTQYQKLEADLGDYRADPERLKRERQAAQMAKARAAKAAKRLQQA